MSASLTDLLDDIAAALVFADASDAACMEDLAQACERARDACDDPALAAALEQMVTYARAGGDGQIAQITAALEALQRAPTAAPSAAFALPEWVDPQLFEEFLAQQTEQMGQLEALVLEIEGGKPDAVDSLRRKLHNLKGEAGVLGLDALEATCHRFEDVLAESRPAERTDAFLGALDWMQRALHAYAAGKRPEEADLWDAPRSAATQEVEPDLPPAPTPPPAPTASPSAPVSAPPAEEAAPAGPTTWDQDILELVGDFLQECRDGLTAADDILLEASRRLAEAEEVNALFRVFHTIKGTSSFLNLRDVTQVAHTTESMLNKVREGNLVLTGAVLDVAFEATALMRKLLDEVQAAAEGQRAVASFSWVAPFLRLAQDVQANPRSELEPLPVAHPRERVGEVLKRSGLPHDVVEAAACVPDKRIGEVLLEDEHISPKELGRALRATQSANSAPKLKETVTVDLARIDHLVEMVGELAIVEAMITNAPEFTEHSTARSRAYLAQFAKIARDIQRMGMQLRMVPLRSVFQKMARIARDVSRKSNKDVQLILAGEATEMDRNMVQGLADPLVHMIRNAVDHGIESAEARVAAGKPAEGTVWLSAFHEGGHIAIEVRDDGRGLDRAKILAKAISKGLAQEGQDLTDNDIYKLIFSPGFSTAAQVTEISGRGVGMDVVKRNIEAMRGHILIQSVPGAGTTMKIVLPLTLAIIDGMLVRSGDEQYILPLLAIVESIQPTPDMLVSMRGARRLLNFRGEILPLLRLSALFSVANGKETDCKGLVVVLESLGHRIGLLVDDVLTQQQVVIKNLGPVLHGTPFISGATILSDGRVGLILNVEELVQWQNHSSQEPERAR